MVFVNQDYANRIAALIQQIQANPDKVQGQITSLANGLKTLETMGLDRDKDVRLEAQEAVLARLCVLQDPEFNKNLTNLEY